jgi:hypothetical protein
MRKPNRINCVPAIWGHRGSPVGFCLESPDRRLRYMPVSKCMSTSLSGWCQQHGWNIVTDFNDSSNSNCRYVVVLRDPVDRWCAGIEMYLNTEHKGFDQLSDSAWSVCLDRMIMDPHTERQWISYHGLFLNTIHAIDFDQPDFSIFGEDAPTVILKKFQERPNRLQKFLQNQRQINRLKHIYQHDYILLEYLLQRTAPIIPNDDYNDPNIWLENI